MSWISRLRNAFRPAQLDRDLDDEFQEHLAQRTRRLEERGVSPEEARRQMALRFGNTTLLQERTREIRLAAGVESALQDLRYGWRALRRNPVFAVTAVLSLAMAIGANTAVYSIVDAAILRNLPVPDPSNLVYIATSAVLQAGEEDPGDNQSFNYPLFEQMRDAAAPSARLVAVSYLNRPEAHDPAPGSPRAKISLQYISGGTFSLLGIRPALGRLIGPEDDRTPGAHPQLVISHDFWQRRYASDPAAIGRTLLLDKQLFTIVGVAEPGFHGIEASRFVDAWAPIMMYDARAFTQPGWQWMRIFGRLRPGARAEVLRDRLQPILTQFNARRIQQLTNMPEVIRRQFRAMTLYVRDGATGVSGFRRTFARPLWIVFVVAIAILIIACANVASLLLARSAARSAEMAMRISLGAGRLRLIRQLLTESFLLSLLAGVLGWLIARLTAPLIVNMLATTGFPYRFDLSLDARVLLFCGAVAALSTLLFGMLPAWQASGTQPMSALRGLGGAHHRLRMGRLFVGVQVAFAFSLVLTGACFLFSYRNLRRVDAGFDPRGINLLSVTSDDDASTPPRRSNLADQVREQVAALPGVQAASAAPWAIMDGSRWTDQIILPGQPPSEREEIFYPVAPNYFKTMGIGLLRGREFRTGETQSQRVIPTIVNMAFVRAYLHTNDPAAALNQPFQHPSDSTRKDHLIVGVAGDTLYAGLRETAGPMVYLPMDPSTSFSLHVRSTLDPATLARLVARDLPVGVRLKEMTTLETLIGNTLLRERLLAVLGGVFAFLGLILASIGLFGLLNYSVARRTREIGIRTALGARRSEIVLLIGRDLAGLVGGGFLVGLAASLALLTIVRSLLFGIRTVDPGVIGTATVIFACVALAAGALPAGRAAAIDPVEALRSE